MDLCTCHSVGVCDIFIHIMKPGCIFMSLGIQDALTRVKDRQDTHLLCFRMIHGKWLDWWEVSYCCVCASRCVSVVIVGVFVCARDFNVVQQLAPTCASNRACHGA